MAESTAAATILGVSHQVGAVVATNGLLCGALTLAADADLAPQRTGIPTRPTVARVSHRVGATGAADGLLGWALTLTADADLARPKTRTAADTTVLRVSLNIDAAGASTLRQPGWARATAILADLAADAAHSRTRHFVRLACQARSVGTGLIGETHRSA